MIYWSLMQRSLKAQNIFLLISSYIFYGWWDYRFLVLILFSTLVDYAVGQRLKSTKKPQFRKMLLWVSLVTNLVLLGFFKYYNFFVESWIEGWAQWGVHMDSTTMQIILPVGISFYTFQTLSYTIDVYKKKIEPASYFINFAAYVSFFPQLVAGPIERASHLLPQFGKQRSFDFNMAKSGLYLILWGLFQKMVIADSCATYVKAIFDNYAHLNGASLLLGAIYFAFQIYGDFAGYSNIAIGTARLFGFDLMRNFNYPYFSRNIAEFWRRWHISLSTWFRDYVYIPLGGSRGNSYLKIRNIAIIFIVSGFWHGANWTFLFWGGLNALYFIPLLIGNKNRKYLNDAEENRSFPSLKEFLQMSTTFFLSALAWIFFRSNSIGEGLAYVERLFTHFELHTEYLNVERYSIEMMPLILFFIIIEWVHRRFEHPFIGKYREVKVMAALVLLMLFGVFSDHQSFIYFQF